MRCLAAAVLYCLTCVVSAVHAMADKPFPYQRCFEVSAKMHKVPLELLLAIAATESNWDADARSHANAHGVMQIQWPGTARHLGVKRVSELYNPCLNIALGAKYMAQLLDDFSGSEQRALAAYNYGPTRISKSATLPAGALKYVNTVTRHREAIRDGLVPARLQPGGEQELVAFASRHRAQKLADYLRQHLQGALVSVKPPTDLVPRYVVMLAIGQAGLTVQDHVTITNLGWQL